MEAGPRGAGAVLYSSLSTAGWRFPAIALVQNDEKFLFDLEVKLKMKHEYSIAVLRDAINDFPAALMVSRTGIIHVLLDILSSAYTFADYESCPACFHPITALQLLGALFQKLSAEYHTLVDGGMVCTVDGPEENLQDDVLPSLQNMRYPRMTSASTTSDIAIAHYEPRLSFSGFAFALCAATLPLLSTKNTLIIHEIHAIWQVTLPRILAFDEGDNGVSLQAINCKRVQHLLSRFEQLSYLPCFQPTVQQMWQTFQQSETESVKGDDNTTEDCLFSLAFLKLLTQFLLQWPDKYVVSVIAERAKQEGNDYDCNLIVESQLQGLLTKLLTMSRQYQPFLPQYSTRVGEILNRCAANTTEQVAEADNWAKSVVYLERFDDASVTLNEETIVEVLQHIETVFPLFTTASTTAHESRLSLISTLAELQRYLPALLMTLWEASTMFLTTSSFVVSARILKLMRMFFLHFHATPQRQSELLELWLSSSESLVHHLFEDSKEDGSLSNLRYLCAQILNMQTSADVDTPKELSEDDGETSRMQLQVCKEIFVEVLDVLCGHYLQELAQSTQKDDDSEDINEKEGALLQLWPWIELVLWSIKDSVPEYSLPDDDEDNQSQKRSNMQRVVTYCIDITSTDNSELNSYAQSPLSSADHVRLLRNLLTSQDTQGKSLSALLSTPPNSKNSSLSPSGLAQKSSVGRYGSQTKVQLPSSLHQQPAQHNDWQALLPLAFPPYLGSNENNDVRDEVDLSVRYSALRQLLQIFHEDTQAQSSLLSTAPAAWLITLSQTILRVLRQMYQSSDDKLTTTSHNNKSSRPKTVTKAPTPLATSSSGQWSSLQRKYLVAALQLLQVVITAPSSSLWQRQMKHQHRRLSATKPRHSDLGFEPTCHFVFSSLSLTEKRSQHEYTTDAVGYDVKEVEDKIPIIDMDFLWQLSNLVVRKQPDDSQTEEDLQVMRGLQQTAREIVFNIVARRDVWLCAVHSGNPHDEDSNNGRGLPTFCVQYPSNETMNRFADKGRVSYSSTTAPPILFVPQFLAPYLTYPKPAERDTAIESNVVLLPLQGSSSNGLSAKVQVGNAALEMVEESLQDLSAPSIDSLLLGGITSFFTQLTQAPSHTHLLNANALLRLLSSLTQEPITTNDMIVPPKVHWDAGFVLLEISYLSAIGRILTTLPRTRKDHFLFYHTLSTLTAHLQSLCNTLTSSVYRADQVYLHRVHALLHDTIATIWPTISVLIVPSHQQYVLQQRMNHSNNSDVHGKSGWQFSSAAALYTRDIAPQFSAIRQEIEHAWLSLLTVVYQGSLQLETQPTSFKLPKKHSTNANRDYESTVELCISSYPELLLYLTQAVAFSETGAGPYHDESGELVTASGHQKSARCLLRVKALQVLTWLLQHPGASGQVLMIYPSLLPTVALKSSQTSFQLEVQQHAFLLTVLKQARLLRMPDAFQGGNHSVSLATLRLLLVLVQELTQPRPQKHCQPDKTLVPLLGDPGLWLWLVRSLYDRRVAVRYIALELVEALLPYIAAYADDSSVEMTVEVDEHASSNDVAWPPLEQLYHLMVDSSEAVDVRAKALQVSVHWLHHEGLARMDKSKRNSKSAHSMAGSIETWTLPIPLVRFVDAVVSLLQPPSCSGPVHHDRMPAAPDTDIVGSLRAYAMTLQSITLLLQQVTWTSTLQQELSLLFKAQRVFPRILAFLDIPTLLQQRSLQQQLRLGQVQRELLSALFQPSSTTSGTSGGHVWSGNREEELVLEVTLLQTLLTLSQLPSGSISQQCQHGCAHIFRDMVQHGHLLSHILSFLQRWSTDSASSSDTITDHYQLRCLVLQRATLTLHEVLQLPGASITSQQLQPNRHLRLSLSQRVLIYRVFAQALTSFTPSPLSNTYHHVPYVQRAVREVIRVLCAHILPTARTHSRNEDLTYPMEELIAEEVAAVRCFSSLLTYRASCLTSASSSSALQLDVTLACFLESYTLPCQAVVYEAFKLECDAATQHQLSHKVPHQSAQQSLRRRQKLQPITTWISGLGQAIVNAADEVLNPSQTAATSTASAASSVSVSPIRTSSASVGALSHRVQSKEGLRHKKADDPLAQTWIFQKAKISTGASSARQKQSLTMVSAYKHQQQGRTSNQSRGKSMVGGGLEDHDEVEDEVGDGVSSTASTVAFQQRQQEKGAARQQEDSALLMSPDSLLCLDESTTEFARDEERIDEGEDDVELMMRRFQNEEDENEDVTLQTLRRKRTQQTNQQSTSPAQQQTPQQQHGTPVKTGTSSFASPTIQMRWRAKSRSYALSSDTSPQSVTLAMSAQKGHNNHRASGSVASGSLHTASSHHRRQQLPVLANLGKQQAWSSLLLLKHLHFLLLLSYQEQAQLPVPNAGDTVSIDRFCQAVTRLLTRYVVPHSLLVTVTSALSYASTISVAYSNAYSTAMAHEQVVVSDGQVSVAYVSFLLSLLMNHDHHVPSPTDEVTSTSYTGQLVLRGQQLLRNVFLRTFAATTSVGGSASGGAAVFVQRLLSLCLHITATPSSEGGSGGGSWLAPSTRAVFFAMITQVLSAASLSNSPLLSSSYSSSLASSSSVYYLSIAQKQSIASQFLGEVQRLLHAPHRLLQQYQQQQQHSTNTGNVLLLPQSIVDGAIAGGNHHVKKPSHGGGQEVIHPLYTSTLYQLCAAYFALVAPPFTGSASETEEEQEYSEDEGVHEKDNDEERMSDVEYSEVDFDAAPSTTSSTTPSTAAHRTRQGSGLGGAAAMTFQTIAALLMSSASSAPSLSSNAGHSAPPSSTSSAASSSASASLPELLLWILRERCPSCRPLARLIVQFLGQCACAVEASHLMQQHHQRVRIIADTSAAVGQNQKKVRRSNSTKVQKPLKTSYAAYQNGGTNYADHHSNSNQANLAVAYAVVTWMTTSEDLLRYLYTSAFTKTRVAKQDEQDGADETSENQVEGRSLEVLCGTLLWQLVQRSHRARALVKPLHHQHQHHHQQQQQRSGFGGVVEENPFPRRHVRVWLALQELLA